MSDVFSSVRPAGDDSGRVVVVTERRQAVRLRSSVVWVGCHWINQHVLCGGPGCPACEVGHPKRSYGFAIVDRPGQTVALIRLSATDVATLENATRGTDPARLLSVGDEFWIARHGNRKPLSVEFIKSTSQVLELNRDYLMLEVLRLHGVQASDRHIRERSFYELIRARAVESCGGTRLMVH